LLLKNLDFIMQNWKKMKKEKIIKIVMEKKTLLKVSKKKKRKKNLKSWFYVLIKQNTE
jgi:hypothetical protein